MNPTIKQSDLPLIMQYRRSKKPKIATANNRPITGICNRGGGPVWGEMEQDAMIYRSMQYQINRQIE